MKKTNLSFLFSVFLLILGSTSCATFKNDGNSSVVQKKTYGDKFTIKPDQHVKSNTIVGGAPNDSGNNGSKPK